MARWFATLVGKRIVLLVFMCSAVQSAPNITSVCSSYVSTEQLASESESGEKNARGVKRSVTEDLAATSTSTTVPPSLAALPNHEIQLTEPHLTEQTTIDIDVAESIVENRTRNKFDARNETPNLLETAVRAINAVSANSTPKSEATVKATGVPDVVTPKTTGTLDDSQGQSSSGSWSYPGKPIFKNKTTFDQASAASSHGGHKENHDKGGGQKHKEEHNEEDGDSHEKGYKKAHKFAKAEKGHHDKVRHKKKYKDEKGKKIKHSKGQQHFGEHKRGEKGRKAAKYDEEGHHKKGHSTKGEHNVHKKDEYHKKHEFYDEHHEGGERQKHAGLHKNHKKSGAEKSKKGRHNSKQKKTNKSIKGGHKKAKNHEHFTGHVYKKGKGTNHGRKKKYGLKRSKKMGKKYVYKRGH